MVHVTHWRIESILMPKLAGLRPAMTYAAKSDQPDFGNCHSDGMQQH